MKLPIILGLFSLLILLLVIFSSGHLNLISSDNSKSLAKITSNISMPDGTTCSHRNTNGVGYIEGQLMVGIESAQQYQTIKTFSTDNPEVVIMDSEKQTQFQSTAIPYSLILKVPAGKENLFLQKIQMLPVKWVELNSCGNVAEPF